MKTGITNFRQYDLYVTSPSSEGSLQPAQGSQTSTSAGPHAGYAPIAAKTGRVRFDLQQSRTAQIAIQANTLREIESDVVRALVSRPALNDAAHQNPSVLSKRDILVALTLDALFKHHFKNSEEEVASASEATVRMALQAVTGALRSLPDEEALESFSLFAMRETASKADVEKWHALPMALPLVRTKLGTPTVRKLNANRACLLPDPEKLDALGQLGFTMHNPLHALLFDVETGVDVLPDATMNAITQHVFALTDRWNESESNHDVHLGGNISAAHMLMAAILDGVFQIHCGASAKAAIFFSADDVLEHVHRQLVPSLLEYVGKKLDKSSAGYKALEKEMLAEPFFPRAHETLTEILGDMFDRIPVLSRIDPDHRWRMLVGPQKIDLLNAQGIDTNNPLLVFAFDTKTSYANRLARAWGVAMSRSSAAPNTGLDVDEVLRLHRMIVDRSFPELNEGVEFGGIFSRAGELRLLERMEFMAQEFNIRAAVAIDNKVFFQKDRHCVVFDRNEQDPTTQFRQVGHAERFDQGVASLLKNDKRFSSYLIQNDSERKFLRVLRYAAPHHDLRNAISAILENYGKNLDEAWCLEEELKQVNLPEAMDPPLKGEVESSFRETVDKVLLYSIAKAYLDGGLLHPMRDGNFRLWGILILNILLDQQGLPITCLYDRNVSAGSSVEEVIEQIKAGQKWCAQWIKTEKSEKEQA